MGRLEFKAILYGDDRRLFFIGVMTRRLHFPRGGRRHLLENVIRITLGRIFVELIAWRIELIEIMGTRDVLLGRFGRDTQRLIVLAGHDHFWTTIAARAAATPVAPCATLLLTATRLFVGRRDRFVTWVGRIAPTATSAATATATRLLVAAFAIAFPICAFAVAGVSIAWLAVAASFALRSPVSVTAFAITGVAASALLISAVTAAAVAI